MENDLKLPTIEEIKKYLKEYGWKFREVNSENGTTLIAPYTLQNQNKGILISFKVEGEFVMVSTSGLFRNVPLQFGKNILDICDHIKLVKIYSIGQDSPDTFNVEVGFELWNESWNKETFFSFMDMLAFGIETSFSIVAKEKIPHETSFVTFG